VREEVAQLVGHSCRSNITVRKIKDLGGPGLPAQMRAAREIVCDADVADAQPEDETGHPTLAVAFLFESDDAARGWMSGEDYQSGHWWLAHGSLIAAGGSLSRADWLKLRRALSLPASGSPM
jgi:hypothetical protein